MSLKSKISQIAQEYTQENTTQHDITHIKVGQNVKVVVDMSEGDKKRNKSFTGTVIGKEPRGIRILRMDNRHQMEIKFNIMSPAIRSISVESGVYKFRQAKPYYMKTASRKRLKKV